MTEYEIPNLDEQDIWMQIDPIHHHDERRGSSETLYDFSRVYVGDVEDVDPSAPAGADFTVLDDGIVRYQYRNKPAVMITQDAVYAREDVSRSDAENQAYFALSVLDENGLVGRWKKQ